MKIQKWANNFFVLCVFILGTSTIIMHNEVAEADFVPPEIETVMIPEYNQPLKQVFTLQPTPLSVVNVLNFVEGSTTRQASQLLKYVYPKYSDAQLKSVTANLEQSNSFLNSQGYKTKINPGQLDMSLLKEELSNRRPVIAYLSANGDYWIEQESSIIIYGYQKVTFPGRPSQVVYMYQSVNHGNGAIYGGNENTIPLLIKESQIDPSANVTYSWISTLYGFTK
ncbi:hypothetical protein JZO66_07020 [Enterococcus sp. DIV0242_7C1]|uniref:Peptidase C39-like domain-containing protein n=1 Tax=Candidatus Enterococcus dunnyi TaxID=1834192 RepID=A0A200IZD9_9ENTE|nr:MULTISPECIES: hypothetical protein [unclassified Enterococcus]MBO0470291.1 hypothetical protein [Enterococcus sp. DIV0242_7C1]OUZ30342.1 hypothetical protein A5889_002630 [Enterococcus sp. 9D6_DIV0238]